MNKKQRETLAKAYEYAQKIGRHQPDVNTRFWKYRDALKYVSEILLANFGAWDKENLYQLEDQDTINENFEKLEKLSIELGCK